MPQARRASAVSAECAAKAKATALTRRSRRASLGTESELQAEAQRLQARRDALETIKDETKECEECTTDFGIFTWKYACTSCSRVLCDICSPERQEKGGDRACQMCVDKEKEASPGKSVFVGVPHARKADANDGHGAAAAEEDEFPALPPTRWQCATSNEIAVSGDAGLEARLRAAESRAEAAEARVAVLEAAGAGLKWLEEESRATEAEAKVAELEIKLRQVERQLREANLKRTVKSKH